MTDREGTSELEHPAGWYPDPNAPSGSRRRYWDGEQWTDHTAGTGEGWSTAGWVAGSVLLLGAIALAALGYEDGPPGRTVGVLVGAIGIGMLIAAAIRFGYVRLFASGGRVWSPWLVILGGVIAVVTVVGTIQSDREEDRERLATAFDAAEEQCTQLAAVRFPSLSPPFRYGKLTDRQEDRAALVIPIFAKDAFEFRTVTRGRATVAVVSTAPIGTSPQEASAARDEFVNGVENSGAEAKTFSLANGETVEFGVQPTGEAHGLMAHDCYARGILARSIVELREVASALGE